jgi:hypothetical protein
MAPPKSTVPTAAQPKYNDFFDTFNSSATGHQRAENRLGSSTGWRQSRTMKLSHQFSSGGGGGKRVSDRVGAGSEDWDEISKAVIPKEVRSRAKYDITDMLMLQTTKSTKGIEDKITAARTRKEEVEAEAEEEQKNLTKKGIFDGLVIYINGSTHPLVSDHKLKHLLAENGARLSIHLGRRQVTHVILGKPVGSGGSVGAGGGLAATKVQKEIQRVGGCGVRYVGVEW